MEMMKNNLKSKLNNNAQDKNTYNYNYNNKNRGRDIQILSPHLKQNVWNINFKKSL
jgi:hypothetical protein